MFKGEQSRGVIGYIIAGTIAYYLNILLSKTTKLTVTQSTFISVYIIGNVLLYSFDILFSKEKFLINDKYTEIPYTEIKTRGLWLLQSLYQKYFFKFLATVIIDTIVGLTLLKITIDKLDELNILKTWKYRNYVVAFIVATITYILYLSTLRFKWAYSHEESIILDILVMAWVSILILVAAINQNIFQSNVTWRMLYKQEK
jgi:hypothetical protein